MYKLKLYSIMTRLTYIVKFFSFLSSSFKLQRTCWCSVQSLDYTKELYKKDLNDPRNHDGMVTHPEPNILECEVKWALGSTASNKASGGDIIPVELFKILKDEKCCAQ